MKHLILVVAVFSFIGSNGQQKMTPELLWKLGRINPVGISKDKSAIVYSVSTPNVEQNKSSKKTYTISLAGGVAKEIADSNDLVTNDRISPDGKYILSASEVKMRKVAGKDYYPDLSKSNVQIYDGLGYRHWDEWEDGSYSHIFLHQVLNGKTGEGKDIMAGQPYDSPQKPFGGNEDFIWSPDSKSIIYVTKPSYGTAYATSTNTDIFQYDISTGKLTNLSEKMMGYDVAPSYSPKGVLTWLSMKREGYEADKQDIVVKTDKGIINLTAKWDNSVESFKWSDDGNSIFFTAAVGGAKHLFQVSYPASVIKQITKGDFDVAGIVGQSGNKLYVTRTDMNHAAEIYSVDIPGGAMTQLTHVNDDHIVK